MRHSFQGSNKKSVQSLSTLKETSKIDSKDSTFKKRLSKKIKAFQRLKPNV